MLDVRRGFPLQALTKNLAAYKDGLEKMTDVLDLSIFGSPRQELLASSGNIFEEPPTE